MGAAFSSSSSPGAVLDDNHPSIVVLRHAASGAECRIHKFGATVVSWKDAATKQERLFVSTQAKLDHSKAIRGGIPLVFPIFGPPTQGSMPQHGFARVNAWTLASQEDTADAATAVFTLDYAKDVSAGVGADNPWEKEAAERDGTNCQLQLTVSLTAHELVTTLEIQNTGTASFDFQCLQHTYLAVSDLKHLHIHGLGGYAIQDKVDASNAGQVQSYDDDITIVSGQEVDRVYVHPEDHFVAKVKVTVAKDTELQLEASGRVADTPAPVSCVVWNPGTSKAQAMSDFGDTEYQRMVCVEPGLLGHQALLPAGQSAQLQQTLRVVV